MDEGKVIASYFVKVVIRSSDEADEGPTIDDINSLVEDAVYEHLGSEDRFSVTANAERADR